MSRTREEFAIEIDPESELAKALAKDDEAPVVIVSDGTRYEVVRIEDESMEGFRPARVREALRPAPTIFTPEEAERLKQDIYRWRDEGTRPLKRP